MRNRILCVFLSFLFTSCADFIEYPLEKESVALHTPANNLVTKDTTLTFWWDTHQDAKYYRIQVVRPDFKTLHTLVMDSVVIRNQLTITLDTGTYVWRVRPENDGSVGLFKEERKLTIKKGNEE